MRSDWMLSANDDDEEEVIRPPCCVGSSPVSCRKVSLMTYICCVRGEEDIESVCELRLLGMS